ncbi:hypothetical protein IE53DRAFT_361230 [Violaceomyces palustris]|uniref:Uncharacterized protein n=1 Tax=Violaceomyces palustris TaxID=1673888 RepID=A0ACD0P1A5_9BASI|nr:hypothetical protein IE53DRAFT_361230 [Violaceomyces palustris]
MDNAAPLVNGKKRKTSPGVGANGSPAGKGSESQPARSSSSDQLGTTGKRIKTARACDSCRRKKIRCDVIDDGGPPMGSLDNGNGGLICAHCRQYGFECTFFLPITETRFKKKREREAEEAAAAAAAAAAGRIGMGIPMGMMPLGMNPVMSVDMGYHREVPHGMPSSAILPYRDPNFHVMRPGRVIASQEWPPKDPSARPSRTSSLVWSDSPTEVKAQAGASSAPAVSRQASMQASSSARHGRSNSGDSPSQDQPPDSRVLGPTSIAYIVHSTAFVPGAAIEAHDIKHHQTFEVGASGDGIIKFHKPPKGGPASSSGDDEEEITHIPDSIRGRLAGDVAEKLVNTYFEKTAMLFPAVTKSEFLHLSPPPPLLLYAICGVAALSREVPREVLGAVRTTLNALFKENDLLSNSSSVTVRALLIMSLHSDLHGSIAVQSGSRCWNRTGIAIRMAQDLGLHRDASGRDDIEEDTFFLEQKRRIWGCCVTADRCTSISLGHPLAIDLTDCDVRLPSPFEILRSTNDIPSDLTTDRPFAFNTEMLKLSILFGRVMKTIYSPTGLMKATDEEITGLLSDIDRWKENLPEELQFRGPDSSPPAGILHIAFACLMMLFFRVFMRISYVCPTHLTFSLTIERMTSLIQYSTESIDWVDKNDYYLDTMQIVSYSMVFCATVQYHAWVRRGEKSALALLKKGRDCVMRYEREGHKDEERTVRAKTSEVITLLYEAASGVYAQSPCSGNLNPTAGVSNRRTIEAVRGLVFKPDPSRPGGGVFVANDKSLVLRDLPRGTVILKETKGGARIPALVRTSSQQNGWQTYEQFRAGQAGLSHSTNASANANAATALASGQSAPQPNTEESANATGAAGDRASYAESLPSAPAETNGNHRHLAGDVWQDANGRLISRRGSKLVTMVPLAAGQLQQLDVSSLGGHGPMASVPGGSIDGVDSNGGPMTSQSRIGIEQGVNFDPSSMSSFNFNPHLNEVIFAPADYVYETPAGLAPNLIGNNAVDPLMLDGLPGEPLDFATWDAFFSKINQGVVNFGNAATTGQGQAHGSLNNGIEQTSSATHPGGTAGEFPNSAYAMEAQMMGASNIPGGF